MARPNIVFICADQLAAAWLGCYGSGIASTPTLDRLAASGVRFERCYATSPICAPNRATMLTGRSPVIHGIVTNNLALAADSPTYARVLQANGYRTGGFGKFHQTPMHCPLPADASFLGFDESVLSEDPKWGPWITWVANTYPQHLPTALAMACGWPNHPRPAEAPLAARYRQEILAPIITASPWGHMYPSPLPAEVHDTTFITNLGLDFMRRHLDEHPGQPFLCHISYVDPHDPYDPPEPYAHMFRPEDMPDALPAEWLADGNTLLSGSQVEFARFDRIYDKPDVIRQLRAYYHGSLRFMDDQVARILALLEERGIAGNTIVLFTSDHGEMLGDHGLMTKGVKPYDAGIRCPLLVAGGGIKPLVSDRLTCTLDLFPTFLDWAGVGSAVRPPLEGKSFAAACQGMPEDDIWQEVSVAYGPMETVVSDDGWRLTRFLGGAPGQLFNLRSDPAEQRNLYTDPAWAAKRLELLERLINVMARPRQIAPYRNYPRVDGVKYPVNKDQFLDSLPDYEEKRNPYL
ncbi:MAG: sulfatase family protein [Anaerolineae bacterium]